MKEGATHHPGHVVVQPGALSPGKVVNQVVDQFGFSGDWHLYVLRIVPECCS